MPLITFLESITNTISNVQGSKASASEIMLFLAILVYMYIKYRFHKNSMGKMGKLETSVGTLSTNVGKLQTEQELIKGKIADMQERIVEDRTSREHFRDSMLKKQEEITGTVNELNDDFKRYKIQLEHKQKTLAQTEIEKYLTIESQFMHSAADRFEAYLLGLLNSSIEKHIDITRELITEKFADILSKETAQQFDFYAENGYDMMVISIIREVNRDTMVTVKQSIDDIITIFVERYKWNGSLGEIVKAKKEAWIYKWERHFKELFVRETQRLLNS